MAEKFRYLRSIWGTGAPTVMRVPVGYSQTIVKGDLIMVDASNGYAIQAGAAATGIIGIATGSVTTTASEYGELDVIAIGPDSVIRGYNYEAGSVDAADASMILGFALYDIRSDGKIDFNDTTGGFIKPIAVSDTVNSTTDFVISAAKLWNA
jgi:hypothetical protein